jgi:hypothetical protein
VKWVTRERPKIVRAHDTDTLDRRKRRGPRHGIGVYDPLHARLGKARGKTHGRPPRE